jgi:hypothetical protein
MKSRIRLRFYIGQGFEVPGSTPVGRVNPDRSLNLLAGLIMDLVFDGERDQFSRPNRGDIRDLATCNGPAAISMGWNIYLKLLAGARKFSEILRSFSVYYCHFNSNT